MGSGSGLCGCAFGLSTARGSTSTACFPRCYCAGGSFTALSNGSVAQHVAMFTPTTSVWSAMGGGLSASVFALANANGVVYAGGAFTAIGASGPFAGARANGVAQWNGTVWSPVGVGVAGTVYALAISSTGLVIAGACMRACVACCHALRCRLLSCLTIVAAQLPSERRRLVHDAWR